SSLSRPRPPPPPTLFPYTTLFRSARLLPSAAGGVPDEAFTQVESALASVVRQRVRLTAVGLPLFLWFSARLFGGLRAALNEVFRSEEHTSELQSRFDLVCRLLLEK